MPTFAECADRYIEAHSPGWKNDKHIAQWESTIRMYVNPVIGKLPVDKVGVDHVMKVLEPTWTSKPETQTASAKQDTRQAGVPSAKAAPEPCGATMQEFNRLQTGMTVTDVNRIIGCPGTELSRAEFGGSSTMMFMWEGTGSWLGNMNATFRDGRLMAKAQMGLR